MIRSSRFFRQGRWLTSDHDADRLIQRQAGTSQQRHPDTSKFTSQAEHVEHQRQVFDDMVDYFQDDIPDDLVPTYKRLAQRIISSTIIAATEFADDGPDRFRILDVACGTGALFPFLIAALDRSNMTLDLTGVDLSSKMVACAKDRAEKLNSNMHSIQMVNSDILDYEPDEKFDAIVANACFGNFYNSNAVLEKFGEWLEPKGCVMITHPLGSDFVAQLHEQDPSTVPHLLPTESQLIRQAIYLPFQVVGVLQQIEISDGKIVPFYFATLVKVRRTALPEVMRFRGVVDSGFGRGGKKLGFPTANLPSSLFANALRDVNTGVYFGWAVLENGAKRHKAVVNVGYSPTFEGQENAEKIIEAHLILDDPLPDFYGETMRLQLVGFLRREIKFPSFQALVDQISADRAEADLALDQEPYRSLGQDAFLNTKEPWVGQNGGDDIASWEFQDTDSVLDELS